MLAWLHSMKETMEKAKKPTSLAEAESTLKVHEQRKTELDTRNAAFASISKAGEHILAAGISNAIRDKIKQSLDELRMVSSPFRLLAIFYLYIPILGNRLHAMLIHYLLNLYMLFY